MTTPRSLSLSKGSVNLQLYPQAPYSSCDPVQSETLGIALERQRGVHSIDSDRRTDFDTWPGVLAYTPAGIEVFSESANGGEYLAVRWSGPLDDNFVARSSHRVEMPGHSLAVTLGRNIRRLMLDPCVDMFCIEELTLRFVGLRSSLPGALSTGRRHKYASILERIAAEFDQPLTLADLALSIGKPELQFLREFSQIFGMTPHAYVVETRLQAARKMIELTDKPLSMIALDCGFSHQSHMGKAFREFLNVTPKQYKELFARRRQQECL
jgi:AraC family transcriptional regulator